MTPQEERAIRWIAANPAYMLGYVESLEKICTRVAEVTQGTRFQIFSDRFVDLPDELPES